MPIFLVSVVTHQRYELSCSVCEIIVISGKGKHFLFKKILGIYHSILNFPGSCYITPNIQ
jgi:hypothetical protein